MPNESKKAKQLFNHKFIRLIQDYFDERDYIEVYTPTRLKTPALEDYIDAIPAGDAWLRTSPELHMKRLLADQMDAIYQIGPCFRAEEYGRKHLTEFRMLEYYKANVDYRVMKDFTAELVKFIAKKLNGTHLINYQGLGIDLEKIETLTVAESFDRYAEKSLAKALEDGDFELILCDQVEPELGQNGMTFLIDYPAELAALAIVGENGLAERWELYIAGLELANAYTELCDPVEQRQRFEETAKLRAEENRHVYNLDEQFLRDMSKMPPCSGVALGIERLMMIFSDITDITELGLFSKELTS